MGKVKIGIYCYLTAVMLIKDLQKCTKPTNVVRNAELIGCHGNRNSKFAKTIKKQNNNKQTKKQKQNKNQKKKKKKKKKKNISS